MDPIQAALDALEMLFMSNMVRVSAFNPNERGDVVQCYWTGADSVGRLTYRVDCIPEDWRTVGDFFTTCWNLVADSDDFSPQTPGVEYASAPLGYEDATAYAHFEAASDRLIDARGLRT